MTTDQFPPANGPKEPWVDARTDPHNPNAIPIADTQDAGLVAGSVPGGLTAEGEVEMRARLTAPDGDMFRGFLDQIRGAAGSGHAIYIQTGYTAFNAYAVEQLIESGCTAAVVGGQVLAALTPDLFFNALPPEEHAALAHLLAPEG